MGDSGQRTIARLVAAAGCVLAGVAGAQPAHLSYKLLRDRALLEPPPIVTDRAMSWRGVEPVGRPWIGRVFTRDRKQRPFPWGEPGPAAYGAEEDDFRRIVARVGTTPVAISPWIRVEGLGSLARLEAARQQWLEENGYTGGTRRFRNPMYATEAEGGVRKRSKGSSLGEPGRPPLRDRYDWNVIEVPKGRAPRFKVRAEPGTDRRYVTRPRGGEPRRFVTRPGRSEEDAVARSGR